GGVSRAAVRHQVEAGRLGRLSRGVYGYADDETNRLRALFRRLPPGTVAGFHTGARLHRFGAVTDDRVHVIVPPGVSARRIRGVATHQTVLPVPDAVEIAGIPCAPAARCAVDLARVIRRADALPVLDLCLRAGACRPRTCSPKWRGTPACGEYDRRGNSSRSPTRARSAGRRASCACC
ncbi:hypothetical protein MTQ07_30375, partial [Micromonospora sp. R42003]|nr:hypothetical protein [Micromonospora sp. R42003]